jgi:hypothetical protein
MRRRRLASARQAPPQCRASARRCSSEAPQRTQLRIAGPPIRRPCSLPLVKGAIGRPAIHDLAVRAMTNYLEQAFSDQLPEHLLLHQALVRSRRPGTPPPHGAPPPVQLPLGSLLRRGRLPVGYRFHRTGSQLRPVSDAGASEPDRGSVLQQAAFAGRCRDLSAIADGP